MDFLILNLYLGIACVPALLALRLGQNLLMKSLASFFILLLPERERENRSMFLTVARVAVCGLAFLYVAGAWSAFCVAIARTITSREEVTWDWLYLSVSFIWCVQLLLGGGINLHTLNHRVMTKTWARWEKAGYTFQSTLVFSLVICGLAVLAWIAFAIWPRLMLIPYGWALNPLTSGVNKIDGFMKSNWWWILLIILFVGLVKILSTSASKMNYERITKEEGKDTTDEI